MHCGLCACSQNVNDTLYSAIPFKHFRNKAKSLSLSIRTNYYYLWKMQYLLHREMSSVYIRYKTMCTSLRRSHRLVNVSDFWIHRLLTALGTVLWYIVLNGNSFYLMLKHYKIYSYSLQQKFRNYTNLHIKLKSKMVGNDKIHVKQILQETNIAMFTRQNL